MPKVIKNKPVGHHEVDYSLECGHINAETIEASIFVPKAGDTRRCLVCGKQTTIKRVNEPYWVDADEDE